MDHDEHVKVFRIFCYLCLFMPRDKAVQETILDSFEYELKGLVQ